MDEIIESMTYEPLPHDDEEPDFHEVFGSPVQMGKTQELMKKMNRHVQKLIDLKIGDVLIGHSQDKNLWTVRCEDHKGQGPTCDTAAASCLHRAQREYNWEKISKFCLGQKLIEVKSFHDQADGFELVFEKTRIQFSADMGQGVGYIVLEVVEIKG